MAGSNRLQSLYNSIAISVGTFFFLVFAYLCYYRELGPTLKPSKGPFVFAVLLGVGAALGGAVAISSLEPKERGFGYALVVEGVLLILLTAIAWALMGPIPLPPEP